MNVSTGGEKTVAGSGPGARRTPRRRQGSWRRWAVALVGLAIGGGVTALMAKASAPVGSRPVELEVALDRPVLLAGGTQRAFVRVALKGGEMVSSRPRGRVNLAIVLDRSGSMTGEKLDEARKAAIMAIDRLSDDDIVSVVTYDDTVQVLAPAGRIGDAYGLRARIEAVEPGGSTALFAGVSKGAHEARKYFGRDRVNRVILLSDGIANVGPSSPEELAELGTTLAREGIAVTTIGLGLDYNEELMTRLAASSDGNHFFAERAADLATAYAAELGEILSVLAQDVDVTIRFADGVRPVRVLGREAEIRGQSVVGRLNQLYARQTKYFLVEVEIPAGHGAATRDLGTVTVGYQDLERSKPDLLTAGIFCRFSDRLAEVEAGRNPKVMAAVARQLGTETNRTAMELRDQGKIAEAKAMLLSNATYLDQTAAVTDSEHLKKDAEENRVAADNLDEAKWKKQRKMMSKEQVEKLQSLGYIEKP